MTGVQKKSETSLDSELEHLKNLEKALWQAADELRANSKLTPAEYAMPVLGLLFLRQAHHRLVGTEQELLSMPGRELVNGALKAVTEEELKSSSALYLPPQARYSAFLESPTEGLAQALNAALRAVEQSSPSLREVFGGGSTLDYSKFSVELLSRLVKLLGASELAIGTYRHLPLDPCNDA